MTDFEPTELVDTFGSDGLDTPLISVLEEIQARHRYLPREAMILISERLGLPLSQVYSVATFYNAFNLERHGRHSVCVCVGTACHVRGAQRILNRWRKSWVSSRARPRPTGTIPWIRSTAWVPAPLAPSSWSTASTRARCMPKKLTTCWRRSSRPTKRRLRP
jgi:hypothetical protein